MTKKLIGTLGALAIAASLLTTSVQAQTAPPAAPAPATSANAKQDQWARAMTACFQKNGIYASTDADVGKFFITAEYRIKSVGAKTAVSATDVDKMKACEQEATASVREPGSGRWIDASDRR